MDPQLKAALEAAQARLVVLEAKAREQLTARTEAFATAKARVEEAQAKHRRVQKALTEVAALLADAKVEEYTGGRA